ncbi:cilia- and flagella-associated protein 91-like [Chelonus insularis]|uniref:cilia- and flagella-associated protein 91-like n=1 Tax=Chelonus insularis TaxID=460826 RepID=UPI00158CBCCA|nr:cilia- and flagella-associated protein 91-like [Chelonus insularis]
MQCNLKKNIFIDEIFGTCESCLQTLSKNTLTNYRDGETQTIPWEPPIISESTPAVLTLTSLTWDNGLPAGINELNIIKKIDIKKAWELVLPPLDSKINFQCYKNLITEMDKDKWAFRNKELQLTVNSKLDGINKIMKIKNCDKKKKLIMRLEKFSTYLNYLKNKEINRIKFDMNRELRKLGVKYREKNLQHNYLQKEDNLLIHEKQINLIHKKTMFKKNFGTITSVPINCNKMCLRETRWTEDKLKTLHVDLKRIRLNPISNKINCL